MNAHDLLDMIGDAKGEYIWRAQQHRTGTAQPNSRRRSLRKPLLIAALIALMLLLVGCAVVYVLRLQDLTVGQHQFWLPTYYDKDGNAVTGETIPPETLISLQGANMEALAEWVAFQQEYDPDSSIAITADNSGSNRSIPETYRYAYGCYSQEMVDKLDKIAAKYDLKLLSTETIFQEYENSVLFGALDLPNLLYEDAAIEVEYLSGYFYPEGTFDISLTITMDTGDWKCDGILAGYRYSLKDYFDPVTGSIGDPGEYTQWNYTRKDGKTVLLVMNDMDARMYADLPDACVYVNFDFYPLAGSEKNAPPKAALEQIVELFDLSIAPKPADMAKVTQLQAEAAARQEADRAAAQAKREAQYTKGYEEYVAYVLESWQGSSENRSFLLYDLNGDGVEELYIPGSVVLSMKDGQSYPYFDPSTTGVILYRLRPCEGNVLEIATEDFFSVDEYYFYQAGAESVSYITGVTHDKDENVWYQYPEGPHTDNKQVISQEEAQAILNSYSRIEVELRPLKLYGKPLDGTVYTDPYAKYIARSLERYEEAVNFQYALMDLNGDGVKELITRDVQTSQGGREFLGLAVHGIVDGELSDMKMGSFSYVCEGGILEYAESYDDGSGCHVYYQWNGEEFQVIEKLVKDPIVQIWLQRPELQGSSDPCAITEEEALRIIASYKRLELDMKPFTEYPLS